MRTGVVEIPLGRGVCALIDAVDLPLVSKYRWSLCHWGTKRKKYARAWIPAPKGSRLQGTYVYMHRLIFGDSTFPNIDHRDGDSLNNTRTNLRGCSVEKNGKNKRVIRAISGFKGVTLRYNPLTTPRPWVAKICVDGRNMHLGAYATAEEAAQAYDDAARRHHGDFAATNAELRP